MEENVHKLVYLAREYPDKTITEVAGLFSLPALEVNAAIWAAQDMGYIIVDEKTKKATVDMVPDMWRFGKDISNIEGYLVYVFERLSRDETDPEENFLLTWMRGYPTHDVLVALKHVVDEGILSTYTVKNAGEKYLFYSLARNAEHKWGEKQFRKPIKVKGGDKKPKKIRVRRK
jgi:hypothetical protein